MSDVNNALENVLESIIRKDVNKLRESSIVLSILILDLDECNLSVFSKIFDIIKLPEFCSMQGSYILINSIFDDLSDLDSSIKDEFIYTIRIIYSKLFDSTTCMLFVEILEQLTSAKQFYNILSELIIETDCIPKSMLALGLYNLIITCKDNGIINSALNDLLKMKNDKSEVVRCEAADMLSRIEAIRGTM